MKLTVFETLLTITRKASISTSVVREHNSIIN